MQRIRLEQAGAGMVLARKVENAKGMVLCAEGTVLTAALLERLGRSGVTHVTVEGRPVETEGGPTLEEELEALERRFSSVAGDPLMEAIRERVASLVRRRYQREEAEAGDGGAVEQPQG